MSDDCEPHDFLEELRSDEACRDFVLNPEDGPLEGYSVGDIWANKRRNHDSCFVIHRLVERQYPKTNDTTVRIIGFVVEEDGVSEITSLDYRSFFLMYPYRRLAAPPVYPVPEEDK